MSELIDLDVDLADGPAVVTVRILSMPTREHMASMTQADVALELRDLPELTDSEREAVAAPDTVRVRIAVLVDADGKWCSAGWSGASEEELIDCSEEHVGVRPRLVWIIADVPIPQPQEIAGQVEPAEEQPDA